MIENQTINETFSETEIDQLRTLAYNNMDNSPLIQMRYVRNALNADVYKNLIHTVLYENNPQINTKLLKALVKICTPRRKHIGVKSIITYNFDDLIERAFQEADINYTSVCDEIDTSTIENLNIYHVHGYLPSELRSSTFNLNLVFSEEDYHKIYRDPYCWSTITQLNSFRESTCLFVGSSLTDPNLRRLLDIARRSEKNNEKPSAKHYAILKREYKSIESANIESKMFNKFKSIDENLRNGYFRSLDINIVWVDDYDEIPDLLLKTFNSLYFIPNIGKYSYLCSETF